jgi:hypothetical protein
MTPSVLRTTPLLRKGKHLVIPAQARSAGDNVLGLIDFKKMTVKFTGATSINLCE